ncbi:hypothetical protein BD626DRAFT_135627 [Schizophyllum amplum]|uniref:Uncharacterized protein n=1 Tax=Schizophyllum amplum TaxID=97359 RepID=A0A550C5P9_9AGAR|nr:hypothetical protein BD626DRAFT_135627 [Auriculariopsis ampla]
MSGLGMKALAANPFRVREPQRVCAYRSRREGPSAAEQEDVPPRECRVAQSLSIRVRPCWVAQWSRGKSAALPGPCTAGQALSAAQCVAACRDLTYDPTSRRRARRGIVRGYLCTARHAAIARAAVALRRSE